MKPETVTIHLNKSEINLILFLIVEYTAENPSIDSDKEIFRYGLVKQVYEKLTEAVGKLVSNPMERTLKVNVVPVVLSVYEIYAMSQLQEVAFSPKTREALNKVISPLPQTIARILETINKKENVR
jgi:hypothetical protein